MQALGISHSSPRDKLLQRILLFSVRFTLVGALPDVDRMDHLNFMVVQEVASVLPWLTNVVKNIS